MMPEDAPTVFIVDDDDALCIALARTLEAAGYAVETFASAEAFLATDPSDRNGCLLTDMSMPDLSGLDLLHQVAMRNSSLPVIIMTGYGDIASAVGAIKAGAIDFIEKPISTGVLLEVVDRALEQLNGAGMDILSSEGRGVAVERVSLLNSSERKVLAQLLRSGATSEIAAALDISPNIVEVHRARIMKKMGAASTPQLVRLALAANFEAFNAELEARGGDDDLSTHLKALADAARSMLGAQIAAVAVFFSGDPGKVRWFCASGIGHSDQLSEHELPADSLLAAVAAERRPRRLPAVGKAPDSVGLPPTFPPIASCLGVPIATRRSIFGWLALVNKVSRPDFTEEDEKTATGLMGQIAHMLELDLLNKELHARIEQQRAVSRFAATALGITELQDLFDEAVKTVSSTLGTEICGITELSNSSSSQTLRAGVGWPDGAVGTADVPAGDDTLLGKTLTSKDPLVFHDLATDTRFRACQFLHDRNVTSGLSVVIPGVAYPLGTLGAYTAKRRGFTADEVEFARTITAVLGQAMIAKQTEIRLRHAQKLEALGTLAGGIAHEINTPIQYIGDNIRFLQESFSSLAKVSEANGALRDAAIEGKSLKKLVTQVERAEAAADVAFLRSEIPIAIVQSLDGVERVRQIVLAVKEFSHPDVKEMTLTDLHRLIQTTITVSRNQWKNAAELVTNFSDDIPPVPCRAGEISQVILNLIVNAAHAIEAKKSGIGSIQIKTARLERAVEIRVSDTGTGIPDEIRGRIFDPFFTTKGAGKGTGQGLAICHSIVVQKHGGSVSVDSIPGEGTTFVVCLPSEIATAAIADV
jgi:FixJ family two-component response regulator/signal transduction histidine kinase